MRQAADQSLVVGLRRWLEIEDGLSRRALAHECPSPSMLGLQPSVKLLFGVFASQDDWDGGMRWKDSWSQGRWVYFGRRTKYVKVVLVRVLA